MLRLQRNSSYIRHQLNRLIDQSNNTGSSDSLSSLKAIPSQNQSYSAHNMLQTQGQSSALKGILNSQMNKINLWKSARTTYHNSLNNPFCFSFSTTPHNPTSTTQNSNTTPLQPSDEARQKIRNIAIVAHVDHGKTTLVDSMLRIGGVNISLECAMDSNQLERQKGITILSKCTNIQYNDHSINIVDTPGHHDFGGQVERIMGMVDGICLIICATQGPMTQTKFVLRKALERNLKPIVIVNKVDRPSARVNQVLNEIFEMFCDLNCPDEFLEYPIYYASGKNGWAVENLQKDERVSIQCILQGIIDNVPKPARSQQKAFSMLVTQTQPNAYFGRMILGRVNSGVAVVGSQLKTYDQDGKLIDSGKITKITKKTGLSEIQLEKAHEGDIVSIAGFPNTKVTHTIINQQYPQQVIPCLKIDEPLMGVTINVNTSPFAGKQGTKLALNDLKKRFKQQAENDVALFINSGGHTSNSIVVRGRGDLHIGLLLQKIRRQGYQFSVTPPEIVFKEDPTTKQLLQPIEKINFEIQDRFTGLIMDKMNHRNGIYLSSQIRQADGKTDMTFLCTTRALIGIRTQLLNETQGTALVKTEFHEYKPYSGPLKRNPKGAIVSMAQGLTTPYILKQIEKFGQLFVRAGQQVYNGLVIGENTKEQDVEVNPTKQKKLTNIRTHAHDQKIHLVPAKILTIQEAICSLRDDQLLEVTPKDIRIRKKQLDKNGRDRVRRQRKNQLKNFVSGATKK